MKKEHNNELHAIEKRRDTLLVLHHTSNTIGMVEGVAQNGELKDSSFKEVSSDQLVHLVAEDDSFAEMFSEFYHQLKDPSDFSFFKVTEYEVQQTAIDLQQYLDQASEEEKELLKEYEISIDAVEVHRDLLDGNEFTDYRVEDRYLYKPEQVDWKMMEKIGLSMDKLSEMGALEPMLKGYKTPMLVPVEFKTGSVMTQMEARLSLRVNNAGNLEVRFYPVRKDPDFTKTFLGHVFSWEDQRNLMESGNMGRVVDLVYPITGEKIPSLISRDRLTNDLIAVRINEMRIPLFIKGVTLNKEQKKVLKEGRALFIEDMLSNKGTLFNAAVQYNADKRYVEFLFKKNIKSFRVGDLRSSVKAEVPGMFRGKKLKAWQVEKLKAGETAYVDGLVIRMGRSIRGI
ncbi:Protein of unknown function [Chryseobacterium oleae]|uniref:Uncharacterized protein n=1 Tax=Chryseobacterium oleae TaxID=491207 RepID=A0A1I4YWJ5_CHROL|nr:DUF3945 domain-containing protein [Chryseobacterium oleae]SFN42388.1 Protein of unknown function [Chryseobacterium oleae]